MKEDVRAVLAKASASVMCQWLDHLEESLQPWPPNAEAAHTALHEALQAYEGRAK